MAAPSLTYSFTNGTTADATQVNTNGTDIINAFTDGTADVAFGTISAAGAVSFNGNVTLGNSSADDITFTGSVESSIPFGVNASYNIGAATLAPLSIYLGNGTKSTRIMAGTVGTSWTLTLPNDVPSVTGKTLISNTSGTLEFRYADKFTATKTTTYVATGDETIIPVDANTGGASFTVTLPAASTMTGKCLKFIRIDNDLAKTVTIDGNASETINGATTYVLYTQYESVTIACDGSNWFITDKITSTPWTSYQPTGLNLGTLSSITCFWKRQGDSILVHGTFTVGITAAASPWGFTLPTGTTIDTAKISGDQLDCFGFATIANATLQNLPDTARGPWAMTYDAASGATYLCIADDCDTDLGFYGFNNASGLLSSGNKVTFTSGPIPVTGWNG